MCSIYGGHAGSSPHAQAIFWGERDEMRLLKLKVRVAMQAQGWSEFDPSNAYRRVGDDELNFAQGNQRMRYSFTLTTWRGLVNHSARAISVDVGGWTDAPRGYR